MSASRDQFAAESNQVPLTTRFKGVISNEINPPEVLSNQGRLNRRNKKQQRQGSKEIKTLKLTGNVDLGSNVFKMNKQLRRRNGTRKSTRKTTAAPTQHPNTISEIFPPNPHRHNHNNDDRPVRPKINRVTSTPYPVTYRPETSTRAYFIESTTRNTPPPTTETTTQMPTRVLEKVIKSL